MGTILSIIQYLAIVAVAGTMFYARGIYLELKTTKAKLEDAKETIKGLKEELQEAYYRNNTKD